MKEIEYKIKSVILGHAVGDALGVPVEFVSREKLDNNPIAKMEGCNWGRACFYKFFADLPMKSVM